MRNFTEKKWSWEGDLKSIRVLFTCKNSTFYTVGRTKKQLVAGIVLEWVREDIIQYINGSSGFL
jgi:hypothetical protein